MTIVQVYWIAPSHMVALVLVMGTLGADVLVRGAYLAGNGLDVVAGVNELYGLFRCTQRCLSHGRVDFWNGRAECICAC